MSEVAQKLEKDLKDVEKQFVELRTKFLDEAITPITTILKEKHLKTEIKFPLTLKQDTIIKTVSRYDYSKFLVENYDGTFHLVRLLGYARSEDDDFEISDIENDTITYPRLCKNLDTKRHYIPLYNDFYELLRNISESIISKELKEKFWELEKQYKELQKELEKLRKWKANVECMAKLEQKYAGTNSSEK